jgi:hypothetical protein
VTKPRKPKPPATAIKGLSYFRGDEQRPYTLKNGGVNFFDALFILIELANLSRPLAAPGSPEWRGFINEFIRCMRKAIDKMERDMMQAVNEYDRDRVR